MTAINYLSAAGMKNAYQIIGPTIIATTCTTIAAVLIAKTFQGLPSFRVQPDAVEEVKVSHSVARSLEEEKRRTLLLRRVCTETLVVAVTAVVSLRA